MLTGTLTELMLAAAAFVGSHFLLSSTRMRAALVGRLGENGFRGAYSAVAAATLAWMIWSYVAAPYVAVWHPPVAARHVSLSLMPFVLILFVAALRKDNPTSGTAGPADLDLSRPGVFSITRHPMLWAFASWAALHLLGNGHVAAMIFFGAFLVLALGGTLAIDAKKRARDPEAWAALAARSSNLPFAAILAGRSRFSGHRLLWPAIVGVVLYVVLLFLHPWLFGASPLAL